MLETRNTSIASIMTYWKWNKQCLLLLLSECLYLVKLPRARASTTVTIEDPDWRHQMIIFKYPLNKSVVLYVTWSNIVEEGPRLYILHCKIKLSRDYCYPPISLKQCNISELLITIVNICDTYTVHSYTNMVLLHVSYLQIQDLVLHCLYM